MIRIFIYTPWKLRKTRAGKSEMSGTRLKDYQRHRQKSIKHLQGRHHINFFGGGVYIKSWTSHPGQYSDLSKGSTKTKSLKVDSL